MAMIISGGVKQKCDGVNGFESGCLSSTDGLSQRCNALVFTTNFLFCSILLSFCVLISWFFSLSETQPPHFHLSLSCLWRLIWALTKVERKKINFSVQNSVLQWPLTAGVTWMEEIKQMRGHFLVSWNAVIQKFQKTPQITVFHNVQIYL